MLIDAARGKVRKLKKYDVVAFGEILIDFTDLGPNEAGISMFAQNPGGAPGNVCVAISRLGGKSSFIGKVGDDMHGKLLKRTLENQGVSTKGMVEDPDVFTTLAFVSVNENGERSFSFARKPGADTQMSWNEMDTDEIENGKIFHIGSLSLTHEPARESTIKAIEHARKEGLIISYDPNYRDSLWSGEEEAVKMMRSLVPHVDVMKISDEETSLLTDHADPAEAAQALLDQGVKIAAVTLGADGALVANKEGYRVVPGFKPDSIADTNGAGDSFWGAFLYQLAKADKPLEDFTLDELEANTRFANAVAALTVSKAGAIPAMPFMDDVKEFMARKEQEAAEKEAA